MSRLMMDPNLSAFARLEVAQSVVGNRAVFNSVICFTDLCIIEEKEARHLLQNLCNYTLPCIQVFSK